MGLHHPHHPRILRITLTHTKPQISINFCEKKRKGCRNDYMKPVPILNLGKKVKLERKIPRGCKTPWRTMATFNPEVSPSDLIHWTFALMQSDLKYISSMRCSKTGGNLLMNMILVDKYMRNSIFPSIFVKQTGHKPT